MLDVSRHWRGLLEGGRTQEEIERRSRYFLLAPPLAVLCFGAVLPIGAILVYSFLEPGTYGGVVWRFSTDAYVQFLYEKDIFDDSLVFSTAYIEIFLRSFWLALLATALALIVGFPTAYFIATRPPSSRMVWVFLITIPYWVNLLIRTLAMLFLLRDEGPLNSLLMAAGIIAEPLRITYTQTAVALGLVYSFLPFMVLPIYAAIERFDVRLIEAAYDLYATRWQVLRHVILPLARPGIFAGVMLVFVPCLGSFLAPDILGGGRELLVGNLIAQQFQASRNWPFGSAVAVILMSMVLVLLIAFVVQQERMKCGRAR